MRTEPKPVVHFGLIASADTVMKSGEDRDEAAARDGVIAFEMEGAGVWENFPGSLVIKGVCDYADSHKSKEWQGYAAATAAAAAKAFLENWNASKWFEVLVSFPEHLTKFSSHAVPTRPFASPNLPLMPVAQILLSSNWHYKG
jgi:hypothetical protein